MRARKIIMGIFAILVILMAMSVSLSAPYVEPPETEQEREPEEAPPPPPIEELIPRGIREDNHLALWVLDGYEIKNLTMERYLIGVVAAEMPASFETEALKAQAVAARTNAMHSMLVMSKVRHPDQHVCTDFTCCTAFSSDEQLRERWGADYQLNINRIIRAVLETDGVYMTFEEEPILAVFHSSSAGRTEASGNVWVEDLYYLRSVDTPETAADVPGFVSTAAIPFTVFVDTISAEYPEAYFSEDRSLWFGEIEYTESGRVYEMIIADTPVRGTALRAMFGLRSTAFTFEWIGGDIVFTTTGFGHGVGLSQYGANVLAADGMNYRDILRAYYTGIIITNP